MVWYGMAWHGMVWYGMVCVVFDKAHTYIIYFGTWTLRMTLD